MIALFWKFLPKTVIVFAIISLAWVGYNWSFDRGYKKSLKDNPANTYNGQTTVIQNKCKEYDFFGLNIKKIGVGLSYERK